RSPLKKGEAAKQLFQPKHMLHIVEPWFLAHDPQRRPQRTIGESLAAGSLVREFQSFPDVSENHGVVAHDITAPHGMNADLGCGSLADNSLAPVARHRIQLLFSDVREDL